LQARKTYEGALKQANTHETKQGILFNLPAQPFAGSMLLTTVSVHTTLLAFIQHYWIVQGSICLARSVNAPESLITRGMGDAMSRRRSSSDGEALPVIRRQV
jgi:hypothetical protein